MRAAALPLVLYALSAAPLPAETREIDLDGDGRAERVEILDGGWRLSVRDDAGAWREATSGEARRSRLVEPAGGLPVIEADGIFWAWDGQVLFPWDSLLERLPARPRRPGDAAFASRAFGVDLADDRVATWEVELTAHPGLERVHVGLTDAGMGLSPWILVDAEGRTLAEGLSMDLPRLYVDPEAPGRRLRIVSVVPAGLQVSVVE